MHGIQSVSPVAGMFIFAIVYFGIMTDAGMLDPIVDRILAAVGSSPPRIVVGTALLALLVHLDGSGAVTFLVTIPVMLPLYSRLGMDKRILACAASMAAGVNFLPWTGPMIRRLVAENSRGVDFQSADSRAGDRAGVRVCVRLAARQAGSPAVGNLGEGAGQVLHREIDAGIGASPARRVWINVALTLVMIAAMIGFKLEPVAVFMVGVVLALHINYPDLECSASGSTRMPGPR